MVWPDVGMCLEMLALRGREETNVIKSATYDVFIHELDGAALKRTAYLVRGGWVRFWILKCVNGLE